MTFVINNLTLPLSVEWRRLAPANHQPIPSSGLLSTSLQQVHTHFHHNLSANDGFIYNTLDLHLDYEFSFLCPGHISDHRKNVDLTIKD